MTDTDSHSKPSRWKTYLTIATFIALAFLVYSLRHQIVDVIRNLGQVNVLWLLLIVPLQLLNYDAYARLYKRLFAILGDKVRYRAMYRLTLELRFVNYILPSGGVSGISYFGLRMRREGVSATKGTLAQVMKFLLVFISFQPLLILGLLFLAARDHVNNLVIVVASALITSLIMGTLLGIYIMESESRINGFIKFVTKALNWIINVFRRGHPETIKTEGVERAVNDLHVNYLILRNNLPLLKWPLIFAFVANTTEVTSLYVVYVAFGEFVNFGAVILAYAVANFAGLISVLPAGIGIYEGLMTAVLAATGIPAKLSIPVTIMFRILTMFIQLIPGYYFYQRSVREGIGIKKKD